MVHFIILLTLLLLTSLWTVMTSTLMRSAIGLAITSAILALIMFLLDSPLASVFELSVCAGLIPVIFIITISFTHRLGRDEIQELRERRISKFWPLPAFLGLIGLVFSLYDIIPKLDIPTVACSDDVRYVIWNLRHLDLIGQILVLFTGVISTLIFFKEHRK
ncbi:MAG: NADH-quinone oxidoreductase subunit J [Candidatus Wallbacteria bacterium]|nr:NADH-quinone oxidoreductase subunit J [Candidatus Wallbacteria bacterium]